MLKKNYSIFLACLSCALLINHSSGHAFDFKKKLDHAGKKMKKVMENANPKKFFDKKKINKSIDDKELKELLEKADQNNSEDNKLRELFNDSDFKSSCGCGCHNKEKKSDEIPPDSDE